MLSAIVVIDASENGRDSDAPDVDLNSNQFAHILIARGGATLALAPQERRSTQPIRFEARARMRNMLADGMTAMLVQM